MCIGFLSKETAKRLAIYSLETGDLETNAHALNCSPAKLARPEPEYIADSVIAN